MKEDETLQLLRSTVENGCPTNKREALPGVRPYWNYRDEISHHNGLLFKGERVIIPTSMSRDMLQVIHSPHLGAEKCKQSAKNVLYWPLWPGMAAQIEIM